MEARDGYICVWDFASGLAYFTSESLRVSCKSASDDEWDRWRHRKLFRFQSRCGALNTWTCSVPQCQSNSSNVVINWTPWNASFDFSFHASNAIKSIFVLLSEPLPSTFTYSCAIRNISVELMTKQWELSNDSRFVAHAKQSLIVISHESLIK